MKIIHVLAILLLVGFVATAQKPETASRLNPEASATWQRIDQAQQAENDRHDKEIARLTELRVVMLQAGSIPKDRWANCTVESGIVACYPPKAEAKATPEKK